MPPTEFWQLLLNTSPGWANFILMSVVAYMLIKMRNETKVANATAGSEEAEGAASFASAATDLVEGFKVIAETMRENAEDDRRRQAEQHKLDMDKMTLDYDRQLNAAQSRVLDVNGLTLKLQERITALEKEREKDQSTIAKLQEDFAAASEALGKANEEIEKLRNDMAAKDKVSTEVIAALSEQVKSLEKRLKDVTDMANKFKKERDEAKEEAEQAKAEAEKASAKILEMQPVLDYLQKRAKEKDAEDEAA